MSTFTIHGTKKLIKNENNLQAIFSHLDIFFWVVVGGLQIWIKLDRGCMGGQKCADLFGRPLYEIRKQEIAGEFTFSLSPCTRLPYPEHPCFMPNFP